MGKRKPKKDIISLEIGKSYLRIGEYMGCIKDGTKEPKYVFQWKNERLYLTYEETKAKFGREFVG